MYAICIICSNVQALLAIKFMLSAQALLENLQEGPNMPKYTVALINILLEEEALSLDIPTKRLRSKDMRSQAQFILVL